MINFIQELQNELDDINRMPIFEFEVINTQSGLTDFITCDVSFQGKSIVAQRYGVTLSELNSKFIAADKVVAYKGDTLDSLLEALREAVYYSIFDSSLFDHKECS